MKHILATGFAMTLATAAAAQPCGKIVLQGTVGAQERAVRLTYARVQAYRALRRSAMDMQAKDGGTLSAADKAVLQAELDRLNEGFSREFCNLKRLDANGREID